MKAATASTQRALSLTSYRERGIGAQHKQRDCKSSCQIWSLKILFPRLPTGTHFNAQLAPKMTPRSPKILLGWPSPPKDRLDSGSELAYAKLWGYLLWGPMYTRSELRSDC
jgi:hypothetical protein